MTDPDDLSLCIAATRERVEGMRYARNLFAMCETSEQVDRQLGKLSERIERHEMEIAEARRATPPAAPAPQPTGTVVAWAYQRNEPETWDDDGNVLTYKPGRVSFVYREPVRPMINENIAPVLWVRAITMEELASASPQPAGGAGPVARECGTCKHKAEPLGYGQCRGCRYSGLPNWEPATPPAVDAAPSDVVEVLRELVEAHTAFSEFTNGRGDEGWSRISARYTAAWDRARAIVGRGTAIHLPGDDGGKEVPHG
jgi:hypothetical protein